MSGNLGRPIEPGQPANKDFDDYEVHLLVYNCDPDLVTSTLGIEPSRVYRKGELIHGSNFPLSVYRYDIWHLDSPGAKPWDMTELVDELLQVIKPVADRFRLLPETSWTMFDIYYKHVGSNPQVALTAEQMRVLADIGAEMWADIYCTPDDYEESAFVAQEGQDNAE